MSAKRISRRRAREEVHFLVGQCRCVGQRLLHVAGFEVRILPNDLVNRHAIRDEVDDQRNRDPQRFHFGLRPSH